MKTAPVGLVFREGKASSSLRIYSKLYVNFAAVVYSGWVSFLFFDFDFDFAYGGVVRLVTAVVPDNRLSFQQTTAAQPKATRSWIGGMEILLTSLLRSLSVLLHWTYHAPRVRQREHHVVSPVAGVVSVGRPLALALCERTCETGEAVINLKMLVTGCTTMVQREEGGSNLDGGLQTVRVKRAHMLPPAADLSFSPLLSCIVRG